MAMMGPPLVSYLSLDKWLDSRCRWPIYTGRYECVRCSVMGGSGIRPIQLVEVGVSQPRTSFRIGVSMKNIIQNRRLAGAGVALAVLAMAGGVSFRNDRSGSAQAETAAATPAALP